MATSGMCNPDARARQQARHGNPCSTSLSAFLVWGLTCDVAELSSRISHWVRAAGTKKMLVQNGIEMPVGPRRKGGFASARRRDIERHRKGAESCREGEIREKKRQSERQGDQSDIYIYICRRVTGLSTFWPF